MLMLPDSGASFLVRTDFASEAAWQQVRDEAGRENQDSLRAYIEPVSDPGFQHASWEEVKAAVPAGNGDAVVLFIPDSITLTTPDPGRGPARSPGRPPFRCVPAELWGIENNLNIANMDWEEFADTADRDGVFRLPPLNRAATPWWRSQL
jgi:hypothetical protein